LEKVQEPLPSQEQGQISQGRELLLVGLQLLVTRLQQLLRAKQH
jgi:hypothetical protein